MLSFICLTVSDTNFALILAVIKVHLKISPKDRLRITDHIQLCKSTNSNHKIEKYVYFHAFLII